MDMQSIFGYIESMYISTKKCLEMGLIGPEQVKQVQLQCFAVVDYYDYMTFDRDIEVTAKKWEKWSAKFDDLTACKPVK